ncbi:MAG: penicillin-insensitive murein endopeptidase [Polyangiaceae bacterium]
MRGHAWFDIIVRAILYTSTLVALLTSSVGAHSGAAPKSVHAGVAMNAVAMRLGRSVGSPTVGHLMGGSRVEESAYLRSAPVYAQSDDRWGLGALVGMIDRSAKAVHRQFPDAKLSVGNLSRPGGGEIDRHASHESGRDADIGFYLKNHLGKPLLAEHFVPFRGDGLAPSWPGASFDDARNWALIAAFITDPVARVSHIFVAGPLRARLLAYAEKIGAPPGLRSHAAELLMQPRGSLPHDDHFHVRISCPSGMTECIENPTAKRPPSFAKIAVPHGRARGNPAHTEIKPTKATPGAAAPKHEAAPNDSPAAAPAQARPIEVPPPSQDASQDAASPPPAMMSSPVDDADGDL